MKLYLKVDHVAGMRSAGGGREPEPAVAAALAELEGIEGVTIHLHSDRAYVKLRDIQVLKETLSVPLNLELAASNKNREHAFDLRPQSVTLVQEPKDVKSDRWPLDGKEREPVGAFVSALKEADILPGLLVKPSIDAVRWAHKVGAAVAVIDTVPFTQAKTRKEQEDQYRRLSDCVRLCTKLGMEPHAGGGIDYRNIQYVAKLPFVALHVGHAIVARSLLVGIREAVSDMLSLMERARIRS